MMNIPNFEDFINKKYKKDNIIPEIHTISNTEKICYLVSYDENGEEISRGYKMRYVYSFEYSSWECTTDDFSFTK